MKDPFCKNEPLDPEIEKMVNRLKRANDLDIPAWKNPPYPTETPEYDKPLYEAPECGNLLSPAETLEWEPPECENPLYPIETPLWERQAVIASEIHIPEPWNVRGCPVGTRLEVKNRCRGKYVGEGFLIVDMEYMCSIFSDSPFIPEWRTVNSHRVAIQPEWKVERI
jgi:hypothetical protein